MSGQELLPSSSIDLPLLPLRDVVVFPHMVIPLFVGRAKKYQSLETAMAPIAASCWCPEAAAKDEPSAGDMFEMAVWPVFCRCSSCRWHREGAGRGFQRAHVERIEDGEEHFTATLLPLAVADERIEDDEPRLRRCAAR